jgi:hypothetical protein
VGGTERLTDLVWPWVAEYVDTGLRLPIDWIAAGALDTVRMLVAGIRIARWRQSVPPELRAHFPKIVIYLHQASFALVIKNVFDQYRDLTLNPGQAAKMLVQYGALTGVYFHFKTQRVTGNGLGDCGQEIMANVGVRTMFRARDPFEVGQVTGDFQLEAPEKPGEFLLRTDSISPVVSLKSPYLQNDTQHGGTPISDIAWARRDVDKELDLGSAQAAGDHYARRLTTATPELYRYLIDEYLDD